MTKVLILIVDLNFTVIDGVESLAAVVEEVARVAAHMCPRAYRAFDSKDPVYSDVIVTVQ
jgi:hypothetical protein